jgi:hypothetical protein
MVRSVSWGVDGTHRDVAGCYEALFSQYPVGMETVTSSEPEYQRTGQSCERGRPWGVVRVRMGDDDRSEPPGCGIRDRLQVALVVRTGIDRNERGVADQVCVGSRAGHDRGVGCREADDSRQNGDRRSRYGSVEVGLAGGVRAFGDHA